MKLSIAPHFAGWIALALASFGPGVLPAQDALRSKDPLERLAGIEALAKEPPADAARQLGRLLQDSDWEVVERAAEALGKLGSPKEAASLTDLALSGPVRRVRLAAARSAAALDADAAAASLLRKIRGATVIPALDALALVLPACTDPPALRSLEALLRERDGLVRAGAARALVLGAREGREQVLADLLASEHLMVRAAALEAAGESGSAAFLVPIRACLATTPTLDPILERRARRALLALAARLHESTSRTVEVLDAVQALCAGSNAAIAARGVRLAREFAEGEEGQSDALLERLAPSLAHADEGLRAQAAAALSALGGAAALERARGLAGRDGSARVRRAASLAALLIEGPELPAGLSFAVERLADEKDAAAREDLVVVLGRRDLADAVPILVAALADEDWRVRVAAAVSLGKTRSQEARAPLERLGTQHSGEWRMRAASLAGLTQLYQPDAVPAVVGALEDTEPMVRRMAYGWLLAATGQPFPAEAAAWRAWWAANAERARLVDLQDLDERRRRFGYEGVTLAEVYRGLDIQVLESRGDHIQKLLGHHEIPHGLTRAGKVRADGPDPRGLFVSNCTGELETEDLEPLEFFLHAGGYLFGSCWAVQETIARIVPGHVRRLETRGEVLDRVAAYPAAPRSPYVEGVFAAGCVPLYELQGAYLIEVLTPERVEVLVDSPEAAERWGGGELAAWFRVGHGVVLDSVNHFDVQGLELAQGLKKPVDRQAYAVDHMGLSYADLRGQRDASFWGNNHRAAQVVHDLSVLRLVTNFVRLRRLAGD